jgi:tetratricopeptide (TPR) repeat protein
VRGAHEEMNDVVPLLKHTPSAQRPEVLEAITVQREPLIGALVESALDTQGGLRHHLLVGPRGIGKTHVLSLVASRVRAADPDTDRVVVAWLHEDPWSVRAYGKFLAAIAARVAEATADREVEQAARALRAAGPAEDALRGEELVREAVGGRRLVLLVENLDEIFRRIGAEGQMRFRALAEDWGQLLVLASTPQLFAGVRAHASPFYGFFAVTHLEELSLESAADLLRRIARLRDDERLLRFLGEGVAMQRLRAIEALAGGHPRVWLLLAGCISVAAIDELVPLFLEALDDLTPYYQARLHELGDQQQEIVMLLSEAGGALSNRALSEGSGIPERQVATILKQLADRGYVRRAKLPEALTSGDRRMSHWELREPLMRLCLDVKQARGEPLRIIVEFLRAWYGSRLLDELNRLPPTAELANLYASEAFRTLETFSSRELLRGTPEEALARVERGLLLQPDKRALRIAKAAALAMNGRLEEARGLLRELLADEPGELAALGLRFQIAVLTRELGEVADSEQLVAAAARLNRSRPDSPQVAGVAAFAYDFAGRWEEAADAYACAIELNPDEPQFRDARGVVLGRLGRDDEALELFTEALKAMPANVAVLDHRGTALTRLGRHEEALAMFDRATELAPDVAEFHYRCGMELGGLGRHAEAVERFQRAIELAPQNVNVYVGQARSLLGLDRAEDALQSCDRALELDSGSINSHGMRGVVLMALGRAEEAVDAYKHLTVLAPEDPRPYHSMAYAFWNLSRLKEAHDAARRAVALDGEDPDYQLTLAEVTLATGDADAALAQFEHILAHWPRDRDALVPSTALLCDALWEGHLRNPRLNALIVRVMAAYRAVGALAQLGGGVVATIPRLLEPSVAQADADAWVDAWTAHLAEAKIARQLLEAARAWKRDRDQKHLLALPPEQREILVGMLPR